MTWTLQEKEAATTLCRFGAAAVKHREIMAIIGGVAPSNLVPEDEDIVFFDIAGGKQKPTTVAPPSMRPLLVGHSVASTKDGLLVMGGGAVCFSMGTFVNKGCYTVIPARSESGCYTFMPKSDDPDEADCICDVLPKPPAPYQYLTTLELKADKKAPGASLPSLPTSTAHESTLVRRRKISSSAEFARIKNAGKPVILESLNLGPCTERWTDNYLLDKIGRDRSVRTRLTPIPVSALLISSDRCAPSHNL